MGEVLLETFTGALESVRGTPIAAPTHRLNLSEFHMDADRVVYRPTFANGTTSEFVSTMTKKSNSTWAGSGPMDFQTLPYWLNMAIGPGVNSTAAATFRHRFTKATLTDAALSSTFWWLTDTQAFQTAYNMLENLTLTMDVDSDDAPQLSIDGFGQALTAVSAPTLPAMVVPRFANDLTMALFLDTSSAIGITEASGRLLSAEIRIIRNRSRKYAGRAPGGSISYSSSGIGRDHAELDVVLEFPDMTQYNLMDNTTELKARLRLWGQLVSGASYFISDFDLYGCLVEPAWDTYADTNRTLKLTLYSQYGTYAQAAGYEYQWDVYNTITTL